MRRPFANYFEKLNQAYCDQPYFVGLKARLLAGFSLMLLFLMPLNAAKVIWLHPPLLAFRLVFIALVIAASVLTLRWARRGLVDRAGNILVLASFLPVHVLALLARPYPEPLSAGFLLFAVDLVFVLLSLVFATRRVAYGVFGLAIIGHVLFFVGELSPQPIAGSLQFSAITLVREGSLVMGLIFCLGLALVRMIEAAYLRSEESLRATRALNENLGRLVAERTRELEAASERANDASRAKGDFLANMSHEIRTPLNGIIASSELLRRRADLSIESAEHVRLISESGELLLKQISDVLDFSKIEAGQFQLDQHRFELSSLITDCVNLLAPKAEAGGVELEHGIAPELRSYFEGDSFRLRQVLLNLLSNAIKFTPPKGKVQLTIKIAGERPLDPTAPVSVLIEVRDTGIGMDEHAIKRIFERFMQADSSTTRRFGGTGLGLAISSRIVTMMGGMIMVDSVLNKGSRFYFTVPFTPLEVAREVVVAPARTLVRLGVNVLVVEDNAINRRILSAQLDEFGCIHRMVTDGVEALAALNQGPLPDVVLMDCHMPNLDGWETTRRLRAWAVNATSTQHLRLAAALPVIALTAAALPEERARCLDAGMNDFLAKPVKLADLQRVLQPFARLEKPVAKAL